MNNQVLTPAGPHYGKLLCGECGQFLTWLPRPAMPLDPAKVPKVPPGTQLPELTGRSPAQIKYGESCRSAMLVRLQGELPPEVHEALWTITECTFWIGNQAKAASQIRWPAAWCKTGE